MADRLEPTDFLHFVELDGFRDDWERLNLDVERDLLLLQIGIMSGPKSYPVIQGTGGLRKMRFAPIEWKQGKRGAIRVCYVYFEERWTVLLVAAYGKNEKESLSSAEKKDMKKYIDMTRKYLSVRKPR